MADEKIIRKLNNFFNNFDKHQYQKGEIIIRSGEAPKGIFYLQRGFVRQYSISEKGDEVTLNLYKPHTFFPMMWALNNTPNNYYFETLTATSVAIAPRDKVVTFIKNEPEILYDLTKRLYKGIDGILKRMEYLMSGDAYKKLIVILLISRERFATSDKKLAISLKLTHKELAAQAGISRETVSREMKKLEKRGLVSYNRNLITIRNLKKIEKEFFYNKNR